MPTVKDIVSPALTSSFLDVAVMMAHFQYLSHQLNLWWLINGEDISLPFDIYRYLYVWGTFFSPPRFKEITTFETLRLNRVDFKQSP